MKALRGSRTECERVCVAEARKVGIAHHIDVLVATDFCAAEVWTLGGLVTFYVLFFLRLGTREVHVAGVTPHPHQAWMMQTARNLTMEEGAAWVPGTTCFMTAMGNFALPFNSSSRMPASNGCCCHRGRRMCMPMRSTGSDRSKRKRCRR